MLTRIDHANATIDDLTAAVEALLDPHQAVVQLLIGIPGVHTRTARVILAEIGTDMSRFPIAGHLASWAGMCPGNNESADKHRSEWTNVGSRSVHWHHRPSPAGMGDSGGGEALVGHDHSDAGRPMGIR
jgi:transposase